MGLKEKESGTVWLSGQTEGCSTENIWRACKIAGGETWQSRTEMEEETENVSLEDGETRDLGVADNMVKY